MLLEKELKPILLCFLYFCILVSVSSANDGRKSLAKRNAANTHNRLKENSSTENSPASISCNNWLKIGSEPSFVKLGDIDVSGNTVTVEALINRTTPWSGGRFYAGDVVSKHTGPNNTNYLLRPSTAEITTTNGYFATPQICDIQLNKTYHVALVYDGATLKFYRNGQLMSSVAATGNLYQNDLMTQIGYMDGNNPGENFIGYINEVRIWKVARTQADIQTYMNGSLPSPTTQTGLVAYYTFDNLLNKQGNTQWNGTLSGNASINNTNPNCADVKQESCCPILSGTLTGTPTCRNAQPSLTFTSLAGQAPYTITYTNGTQTFTQTNVISGVAFTVPETIQNNTYYTLLNIKDANGCSSNVSTTSGGSNLIANGDFSQGNTGFTSSYHYTSNNVTEGEYYVGSNSYVWNPHTAQCFDHTSGSGNMMLVNGAPTVNVGVWKQTITVTPNTNYVFSAWIESISPNNPAMLQFSINGTQLGNVFQASSTTCLWQQFYTTWNSGNNTTAVISLINQNNIVQGNDFAIDDISFTGIVPVNEKTLVEVKDCGTPSASFTAPDTVCVNTPVNITNTSVLGNSFYWNFSVADINKTPIGQNIGNIGGMLSSPVFIDVVSDNGNYYGFQTNYVGGHLIRFDFGNSMLNTPAATDLGNFGMLPTPIGVEGIQVVKNNGKWYAIIVGGGAIAGNSARIVKIDFGTNIANNAPTATNWGNLGGMEQPIDLNMFEENGNWYGFTVNADNNTVTKFSFGNNVSNPPVATNLGGFGLLNYPTGINAIHENNNWYVFITNATSSTITRLDFGNSLNNTPTAVNLGNPSNALNQPRDLIIMRFCGQLIGFVANGKDPNRPSSNDLTKLDFNDLITNVPTGTSLGNIANFQFPHSLSRLFREGSDLYTFIPNVQNNTLSRLKFAGSNDVNIPNSPLKTPPTITYSKPGIYNVNLLMDEGLPTQSSFCKSIVVVAPETAFLGSDVSTCDKTYTIDGTRPNAKSYLWSNGATTPTITVNQSGDYWVEVTTNTPCPARDTINITFTQCVVASFAAPDTVCVNTPVTITNTSTLGSIFYWNFCVANVGQPPLGDNMGTIGGSFNRPVYIDYVLDNGNYYGFVTNNSSSSLIRLDFGNSLLNTPTAVNLGNPGGVLPSASTEGVQIVKNEDKWYVIIVGGDPAFNFQPFVAKIELGTNITNNAPTGTNWGNIGGLNYPHDLFVFNDNGHWYGMTANTSNSTITRLDFGTSFSNIPTGVNLGNVGQLTNPTGLHAIKDNGRWFVFATNVNSQSITRLDFGSSLLNTPTGYNLGNVGGQFKNPWDIYVMNFCDSIVAFVSNSSDGTLTKLNFGGSLLNNNPTAVTFANVGNQNFPHCLSKIFRVGSDLFSFVMNVNNNTITRLRFPGCTNSSIPNSTLKDPPSVTYSIPGVYNINLAVDEGLSTQTSFCKSVVVLAAPDVQPLLDTFLCRGDSLKLQANFKYGKYLWSNGATDSAIFVKTAGNFSVEYDYYGCKGKDDYTTTIKELPLVNLGVDTSICKNDSLLLDPKNLGAKFLWQDKKIDSVYWAKTAGSYNVKVTDAFGCVQKDTVAVGIFALPNIGLPDSSYYCKYDSLQLDAGKNAIIYSWDNGAATQTIWAKSVGNYIVKVTDANGCINKDTSYISERALPLIDLIEDTSICKNDSLLLDAGTNAVKYAWQDGSLKNTFKVKQAGFYKVIITDRYGCSNKDSLTVSTLQLPVVNLASNASICKNDSLLLDAGTNGVKYLWQDGSSQQTIWAKQGGNYVVAVTDGNNCTNKDTTALSILQLPVITLADNTTICIGSAAQINASSATGTIYVWSSSPTLSAINISNPIATPTDTTKYYLKVTDANNCSNKDSITVNVVAVPTVAMSKDTAICSGSSIVLKTQATSTNKYDWSPATTLDNPSIANPTAKPAAKTTYTVKASNEGCAANGQVTIDILPLPTIVKSNDTTICIPGSAQLKASGGVSYKWYPVLGLSNALIANPVATTNNSTYYKVQVTDANNCSKLDSVLVKVLPKPVFAIDPGNPALCINDSLLVTASGGDVYQWTPATNILNTNNAAATVFPNATTDYVVTITNKVCNVTDVLTAHIKVNPLPTISMRKSNDIDCINPSTNIAASGGIEYKWWPAEYLNDPTAISPVASVLQNTEFYVEVTDKNTCSNTDSIMVNVTHDGENLFVVPNAFTPNGDGQNDCFNIRHWGVNNKLIDFSIYDRWGTKVWATSNIADCWDGTFKGQPEPGGGFVYIIHAKTICGDIVRKGMVMLVR
ncbi:gliding motility-associated C-terminal domain-containing protein [Pinibacter soli]|uniref:Gliding motility-associated C-terminal domain-containing protein n=1 Tax=Pinibacter soli TaxID=3044211 RepID=A0ABT6RH09_9BACT|nr:gliding motility-associated C-terminal domain-containing protein [Pinibacter soli]MDI3321660.1 gliding motility-associated C-terminal domain-containing protein [Pinibacter soli]